MARVCKIMFKPEPASKIWQGTKLGKNDWWGAPPTFARTKVSTMFGFFPVFETPPEFAKRPMFSFRRIFYITFSCDPMSLARASRPPKAGRLCLALSCAHMKRRLAKTGRSHLLGHPLLATQKRRHLGAVRQSPAAKGWRRRGTNTNLPPLRPICCLCMFLPAAACLFGQIFARAFKEKDSATGEAKGGGDPACFLCFSLFFVNKSDWAGVPAAFAPRRLQTTTTGSVPGPRPSLGRLCFFFASCCDLALLFLRPATL
nr:hypothetical protein [Pandoravirus massiliensis]